MLGIIPAYAGSTPGSPPASTGAADHPRIRGEHPPRRLSSGGVLGSSPHTRGAPRPLLPPPLGSRIIPAYAGSTGPGVFDPPRGRDHPRIRGEHFREVGTLIFDEGSSPHTRGARNGGGPLDGSYRIIPAYAGSTSASRPPRRPAPDHPRIRGEHTG